MILNHDQILALMEQGVIEGAEPEQVNGTSLDVTLDRVIMVEAQPRRYSENTGYWHPDLTPVSLRERQPLTMVEVDMEAGCAGRNPYERDRQRHPHAWEDEEQPGRCLPGYILRPGEFILAATRERFNLPLDLSAEYKLKSSMARVGLNHLNAGWCDPGWHGSALTLELVNTTRHHSILIQPGDRIGQLVFFRSAPVPAARSYIHRGAYNNDRKVQVAKPPVQRKQPCAVCAVCGSTFHPTYECR